MSRRLHTDYKKAKEEVKDIAAARRIILPVTLSEMDEDKCQTLCEKEGSEFDKAYCNLLIAEQKRLNARFKLTSARGNDPELRNFASKTLPLMEKDLAMLEQMIQGR